MQERERGSEGGRERVWGWEGGREWGREGGRERGWGWEGGREGWGDCIWERWAAGSCGLSPRGG